MTTTVRFFSDATGGKVVAEQLHPAGDPTPLSAHALLYPHAGGPVRLRRHPGAESVAYLINEGPGIVHVGFMHDGRYVGPHAEYLLPGQCRVFGGGSGVTWVLGECAA